MVTKQKILIVDDDNNIAELISLYLTKECFETAQDCANAGNELLCVKWFDDVVICTELQTEYLIEGFSFGREHDDRHNISSFQIFSLYFLSNFK